MTAHSITSWGWWRRNSGSGRRPSATISKPWRSCRVRRPLLAGRTYHQLGMVAQEQRQWAQAERYYQQALQSTSTSTTATRRPHLHQLGMVAQEQRQWAQAERYYQQALNLIDFDDRYKQAPPTTSWAWWRRHSGSGRRPSATISKPCRSISTSTTATRRPHLPPVGHGGAGTAAVGAGRALLSASYRKSLSTSTTATIRAKPTTSWASWPHSKDSGRRHEIIFCGR